MATQVSFLSDIAKAHPLLLSALQDRIVGCLIGSALGDAIGLYTELLTAAESATSYPSRSFSLFPKPTPFRCDRHRLVHQPGDWTSDTEHALLVLLSFLRNSKISTNDFAHRLSIWVRHGLRALDSLPLKVGNYIDTVAGTDGFGQAPQLVAKLVWERTGKSLAPNGSLMRTHPVGLACLVASEVDTFAIAAELSRATHADPRCVVSCAIGSALVRGLVRGEFTSSEDVDGVVERVAEWFLTYHSEHELNLPELKSHVNAPRLADLGLDEPDKIGYVYKCLGSGLVLLRIAMREIGENGGALLQRAVLFEELITELVMCGGDADTNACFAGALLGSYLGYGALPQHWKHGLQHEMWLMEKAEALCQVLQVTGGKYKGEEDTDAYMDGGKGYLSQENINMRWNELRQRVRGREARGAAHGDPQDEARRGSF